MTRKRTGASTSSSASVWLLAGGAGTGLGMWWTGRRVLPAPPVLHPSQLAAWWTGLGPLVGVFAGGRLLVCLGVAATTVAVAALQSIRALTAGQRFGRAASRWLGAGAGALGRRAGALGWRGLGRMALGLSASTGLAAGCAQADHDGSLAAPGLGPDPPAPVLSGPYGPAGAPTTDPAPARPATDNPATDNPATATPTAAATPPTTGASTPPAPAPTPQPPATHLQPSADHTWVVRPGDDLWSIAETVVSTTTGGGATTAEVARYWKRLITVNRSRLPHPSDPDLIFPGDMLVLPPPPPAGG